MPRTYTEQDTMDGIEDLVRQLNLLAASLDAPDGPGSGAIALDAASALEEMQRRLRTCRADEPTTT